MLLALHKLDKKDPLFSTVKEIAAKAELHEGTVRHHLRRLHYIGRFTEFSEGAKRTSWRLNKAGASRANQLKLLKPRQRLIWLTLRRIGEGTYADIAKAAGLSPNGVSQTMRRLYDRKLVSTVYNTGDHGPVWTA